jgi:hypothetical protein
MAANKATVSVSASVMPDDMKAAVGGTIVYDLNDSAGDTENWVYYANNVSATNQAILPADIGYLAGSAGDLNTRTHANDTIGFLVIKHSGFQGDGTTASTDNLYFNFTHGVDADNATGNLILEPGDVWWGRFAGTADTADLEGEAAANDIKVQIYAVLDDVS